MNTYSENVKLWMHHAEPDYFMFFIKAWIPFNAWYVNAYPTLNKNDKDIIRALQEESNSKPKKIIQGFIENSTYDSLKFQSYFAELHHQLQRTNITHNDVRLSFENLRLNTNPIIYSPYTDDKFNVYKAEKTTSYFQAYIQQKGGKVLLDHRKPVFDKETLIRDNDYLRLERKVQAHIIRLYENIDPRKPISIISSGGTKKNSIIFKSQHNCKIINDTDTVAKACIKVLYILRCTLFHGEITPSDTNKEIYANAYKILKLIINELK